MNPSPLESLSQRLGYTFRQRELLTCALTHRSFGTDHNERLEFLGDSVLNMAVSDLLFDQFKEAQEQCRELLAADLPLPAYDQAIKASHFFNLLNARGVISVAERQAYIARVRELTKGCCESWAAQETARG